MEGDSENPYAATDESITTAEQGNGKLRWLVGIPLGFAAHFGCLALAILTAPRYAEGIRQCVDLPWPVYAIAPHLAAVVVSYLTCRVLVRQPRIRIMIVCVAAVTILLLAPNGIGLLRRDYIGKF